MRTSGIVCTVCNCSLWLVHSAAVGVDMKILVQVERIHVLTCFYCGKQYCLSSLDDKNEMLLLRSAAADKAIETSMNKYWFEPMRIDHDDTTGGAVPLPKYDFSFHGGPSDAVAPDGKVPNLQKSPSSRSGGVSETSTAHDAGRGD